VARTCQAALCLARAESVPGRSPADRSARARPPAESETNTNATSSDEETEPASMGNRDDSEESRVMVDAIPRAQGDRCRPRCAAARVLGDATLDA
jgi:hypothetical protein